MLTCPGMPAAPPIYGGGGSGGDGGGFYIDLCRISIGRLLHVGRQLLGIKTRAEECIYCIIVSVLAHAYRRQLGHRWTRVIGGASRPTLPHGPASESARRRRVPRCAISVIYRIIQQQQQQQPACDVRWLWLRMQLCRQC